jgi:hypothetical protein
VFYCDTGTVYYLSGTTGWGSTFGGLPTAVWILPVTPPLGITTISNLPLVVYPMAGTNYVLEMTTNLSSGNWVPVTNAVPFVAVQVTNPPGTVFFRLH